MTTPTPPRASVPSDAATYVTAGTTLVRIGTQILDWDRASDRLEIQRKQAQIESQLNQMRADVAAGDRAANLAYNELLIVQRAILQQIADARAESDRRALISSGPPPPPKSSVPWWLYALVGASGLAVVGAGVVYVRSRGSSRLGPRSNPRGSSGASRALPARIVASESEGSGPGLKLWHVVADGADGAYAYLEHGSPAAVAKYLRASGLTDEAGCVRGLEASRVGYLSGMEVPPNLQGNGIGTSMLNEALKRARASGVEYVLLDALPTPPATREKLVAFYEKFGFSVWNGCGKIMPFMFLRLQKPKRR